MSIGMGLSESKSWQHDIPQETLDSIIFLDSLRFTPPTWIQTSPPSSPRLKRRQSLPSTGWPTVDIFVTGEDA